MSRLEKPAVGEVGGTVEFIAFQSCNSEGLDSKGILADRAPLTAPVWSGDGMAGNAFRFFTEAKSKGELE